VDTNVLVRLITGDDAAQAALALSALDQDFVLLATVMVEAEWVLRSRYRMDRPQRAAALKMIIDLPHAVDIPENAEWALARMMEGADFADMMHVAAAKGASGFATFDKAVANDAGVGTPVPIETLN
jgi:predicted nucleic-acid-binding protein